MNIPTASDPASRTPGAIALAAVLWLALVATARAGNCEDIRAGIDARIKTSGVANYTLTVVDTAADAPGKVVGSCDRGSKKIVYSKESSAGEARTTPPAPIPAKPSSPNSSAILTECKDGSVSVGGDCRK